MKPLTPSLRALLATRQFYAADLYTLSLVDGTVLRYCGGDRDVSWNGNRFAAGGGPSTGSGGPYFDRSSSKAKCHWKIGIEVDQLVLDVIPGNATIAGLPFLAAVRQGVLDGAELTLERGFMPTYGDVSAGTVAMFAGRIAEIDAGRSVATLTVNSHLELLNLNLPRNLYMPGCVNTLGDAACGVTLAAFAAAGSGFAFGGDPHALATTSLAQPSGYYDLGKLQFTTGANAGLWRSVKSYIFAWDGVNSILFFTAPFPRPIGTGDAFTVYPGCDKTLGANGCAKFANQARFRGFPFVPVPETAV
jgi:uncharacterized phage protein (TIGR02218 family)